MITLESGASIVGPITFDEDSEIHVAPGATNVRIEGVHYVGAAKMCPKCKKSGKACKC